MFRKRISISLVALLLLTNRIDAATFQGLAGNASRAAGVSGDGSTVVGQFRTANGSLRAFRWDSESGLQSLGVLGPAPDGNPFSFANGVSADGSVIVGETTSPSGFEAFSWQATSGFQGLGFLGDVSSEATDVSADGSVVIGTSNATIDPGFQGFVWSNVGGMTPLPSPDNHGSRANSISPNGLFIAGTNVDPVSETRAASAALWRRPDVTSSFQFQNIGSLSGLSFFSEALDVSSDGAVAVGYSQAIEENEEAFRWTETGGLQGLGHLQGFNHTSRGLATNHDGSIVVGVSSSDPRQGIPLGGPQRAIIWTELHGMRDLQDVLISDYSLAVEDWTLISATDISATGRVLVGTGRNPQGLEESWIADLRETVVLAWDEDVPFEVKLIEETSLFGTTTKRRVLGPGSMPADTSLSDVQQLAIRESVEGIFNTSGTGVVRVINAPNDADAFEELRRTSSVVYFTKSVPGLGLAGRADGLDRYNEDLAGRAVVFVGPTPTVSNLAEVVAHETGHLLGLRHVAPSGVGADIMTQGQQNAANELFQNTVSTITDSSNSLGIYDHNPVFHLERWVGDIAAEELDDGIHLGLGSGLPMDSHDEKVEPGVWDRGGGLFEWIIDSVNPFDELQMSLFDVQIWTESGLEDLESGETQDNADLLLAEFDEIRLSGIVGLSFESEFGHAIELTAASSPGTGLDIVLATGDPYEFENRLMRPIAGTVTAYLQIHSPDTLSGFSTLAEVVVRGTIVPEPSTRLLGVSSLGVIGFITVRRKSART
jgi:probable HAF family extracellular repeat protein